MTNWSTNLRRELQTLAATFSNKADTKAYRSNETEDHVLLFPPAPDGSAHGNFVRNSYAAIQSNPEWKARLAKRHTHAKSFPPAYQDGAAELDSCMSSDALLMNCFCYPGFVDEKVGELFGVGPGTKPKFGVKAKVRLSDGSEDLTEIDLQLGTTNVEAKLTEGDFTRKSKTTVEGYADFASTFEKTSLASSDDDSYLHYQLIRNVLAAKASAKQRFVLIVDARRPDLLRAWWSVQSAIKEPSLRARCGFVLWQELAELSPPVLRKFLQDKYGLSR